MKRLTTEDYKTASALLKSKCLTLWKVENENGGIQRDIAQTRFPINLRIYHLRDILKSMKGLYKKTNQLFVKETLMVFFL